MKFKEINGEVFCYLDKPTEIDINTKAPLLVRYYQGTSRMGLLNADLVSKEEQNPRKDTFNARSKVMNWCVQKKKWFQELLLIFLE